MLPHSPHEFCTSLLNLKFLSFSFFMLSLAKPHNYYQVFLSQAIGMGLGMGLVIVPAVSIPAHYFRRRRLLAMGFIFAGQCYPGVTRQPSIYCFVTGSSLGGVIFPIMLNRLINGRVGFAWGIRFIKIPSVEIPRSLLTCSPFV